MVSFKEVFQVSILACSVFHLFIIKLSCLILCFNKGWMGDVKGLMVQYINTLMRGARGDTRRLMTKPFLLTFPLWTQHAYKLLLNQEYTTKWKFEIDPPPRHTHTSQVQKSCMELTSVYRFGSYTLSLTSPMCKYKYICFLRKLLLNYKYYTIISKLAQ